MFCQKKGPKSSLFYSKSFPGSNSSLIYLNSSIYFLKNFFLRLYHVYGSRIILYQLLVKVVFVVSALFFSLNKARFQQNLDVVANGGLGKVNYALDLGTLATSALFGYML